MTRLKDLRKEKNLKQKEVAELVNKTIPCVCDWENGKKEPSIEDLIKLANFFEVTVDYLIGRSSDADLATTYSNLTLYESNLLAVVARLSKEDQFQVLGFAQALAQ